MVGIVKYWIFFEWNKQRCTYVHLKNSFLVEVVTLLYKWNEIWNGIYIGLYTNIWIDLRRHEMTLRCPWIGCELLLENSWHTSSYRITIVWETVTLRSRCVKCHSDVCFMPSTLVLIGITIGSWFLKLLEKQLNVILVIRIRISCWQVGRVK